MSIEIGATSDWLRTYNFTGLSSAAATIIGKVKVVSAPGAAAPLIEVNNIGASRQGGIYTNASNPPSIRAQESDGTTYGNAAYVGPLSLSAFKSFAWVGSDAGGGNSAIRVYVDAAYADYPAMPTISDLSIMFGTDYYSYLHARFADLIVYDHALTPAEVAAQMASMTPLYGGVIAQGYCRGPTLDYVLGALIPNPGFGMSNTQGSLSSDDPTYGTPLPILTGSTVLPIS